MIIFWKILVLLAMDLGYIGPRLLRSDLFRPKPEKGAQKSLKIHVFDGGFKSNQSEPFIAALKASNLDRNTVSIVNITVKDVKAARWSLDTFIDFFLDCDCHFLLSHIHQGIIQQLEWSMSDVNTQLLRLSEHPGFPTGSALICPVFTQDKIRYLNALPNHTNPTLRINLTSNGNLSRKVSRLISE